MERGKPGGLSWAGKNPGLTAAQRLRAHASAGCDFIVPAEIGREIAGWAEALVRARAQLQAHHVALDVAHSDLRRARRRFGLALAGCLGCLLIGLWAGMLMAAAGGG